MDDAPIKPTNRLRLIDWADLIDHFERSEDFVIVSEADAKALSAELRRIAKEG